MCMSVHSIWRILPIHSYDAQLPGHVQLIKIIARSHGVLSAAPVTWLLTTPKNFVLCFCLVQVFMLSSASASFLLSLSLDAPCDAQSTDHFSMQCCHGLPSPFSSNFIWSSLLPCIFSEFLHVLSNPSIGHKLISCALNLSGLRTRMTLWPVCHGLMGFCVVVGYSVSWSCC